MDEIPVKTSLNSELGALQVFIALGALGGGILLISDPSGQTLALPVNLLDGSPFQDFLIPGIILFTINGVGSIIGAVFSFRRARLAAGAAMALGAFLVAWIIIQLIIIRSFHWLHLLYLLLGFVEFAIGRHIRGHISQPD
jgi:hypothetical protein